MYTDPGISSEIPTTQTETSVDNTHFRSLKTALHGVIKQGRWGTLPGGKPVDWSAHRNAGVRAISRAVRSKEPPIERCFSGELLVAKFRDGKLYPYPLEHRRVDVAGELRPGDNGKALFRWRAIHTRALAIVVTAHLVCQTQGLVIRQSDFADLLGVCRDTANTVLSQLVLAGHLAAHPRAKQVELEHGGRAHHRLANRYTVTDLAIAYWSITPRRGRKSSQAPRSEKSTAKASVPAVLIPESTARAEETSGAGCAGGARAERAPVPRETPDGLSAAERVKTRPDAPQGLYDRGGDGPPANAYDAHRELLEELVDCLSPALRELVELGNGGAA